MKVWDSHKGEFIETPANIVNFYNDIEAVCKRYDLSISHEDGHGSFELEPYCDDNIDWLRNSNINTNN